ncbi:MAG: hypothetical protein VYA34_02985 [Myxococcota bacterium]|nr:hypothetical protein [Myxococcota bacterium]
MDDSQQTGLDQVEFDGNNLYREERLTDLKTGGLKLMRPVTISGEIDASRELLIVGQTQVMTQAGPVPIDFPIEAKTVEEAVKLFPKAVEEALAKMMEEMREMQRREASRIVVPGGGGGGQGGGMPGMPGSGGGRIVS